MFVSKNIYTDFKAAPEAIFTQFAHIFSVKINNRSLNCFCAWLVFDVMGFPLTTQFLAFLANSRSVLTTKNLCLQIFLSMTVAKYSENFSWRNFNLQDKFRRTIMKWKEKQSKLLTFRSFMYIALIVRVPMALCWFSSDRAGFYK